MTKYKLYCTPNPPARTKTTNAVKNPAPQIGKDYKKDYLAALRAL
jgi:hypothetical protein